MGAISVPNYDSIIARCKNGGNGCGAFIIKTNTCNELITVDGVIKSTNGFIMESND